MWEGGRERKNKVEWERERERERGGERMREREGGEKEWERENERERKTSFLWWQWTQTCTWHLYEQVFRLEVRGQWIGLLGTYWSKSPDDVTYTLCMAIDSPRRKMTPVNSTSAIHRVKSTDKKISKAQVVDTIPKQPFEKKIRTPTLSVSGMKSPSSL